MAAGEVGVIFLRNRNRMSENSNIDIFARITSVLGLLVAIIAVALPFYQAREDEKEKLNIWRMVAIVNFVD